MRLDKKKLLLPLLYVVIIAVAGYVGYRAWTVNEVMASMYNDNLGQYQGNPVGRKVIVEFLDYRCSYCRMVDEVTQKVIASDPEVKIIYRHFPIFGRPAVIEAEVALAAGMQGRFSEAHNILINREEPITDREIDELADRIGVNKAKFRRDMKGPEIGVLLLHTLDSVQTLGIRSTPTFLVGDIIYSLEDGLPTEEVFAQLLREAYGE